MGHEIGYHYENLAEVSKKNPQITQIAADCLISRRHTRTDADIYPADLAGQKESSLREKKPKRWRNDPQITQINADERQEKFRDKLFELAICDFGRNLEKFRKFYPVKTICMHGSPLSKWDNRDLWI